MCSRISQCLLVLVLFLFHLGNANAQVSKQGKKLYPDFKAFVERADTSKYFADTAISLGLIILQEELGQKEKGLDTMFFGNVCYDIAFLFEQKYDYELAVQYYLLAASSLQKAGNYLKSGRAISKYLYGFKVIQEFRDLDPKWGKSDSLLFKHGNADTNIWYTVKATSIRKTIHRDTIWVNVEAGRAHGIKPNSKFDVFTTWDTFSTIDRKIVQGGTGFITEVFDFYSTGYIVLSEGFTDTLYKEDAFEVKVNADKTYLKSQLTELAVYNVGLYNYTGEAYYTGGSTSLTLNNARFDLPVKLAILQDLNDAADYYNLNNPGVLDVVIKSGRFKGSTYEQCMRNSTLFDIEMFMDFVISFPGKYLNRNWSFAEVYVTWVINNCPLGNDQGRVLDSILNLNTEKLALNSTIWGEYYKQVSNADSLYLAQSTLMFEFEPKKRMGSLLKMWELAKANNNFKSDSFFTMKLVVESYSRNEYNKTIEYANRLWPIIKGFDKQLIALYKGLAYSNLDQYDNALIYLDSSLAIDSTYYYAIGFKGWNLIKKGNIKQALPYCKYAWEVDSAVSWTNINLAHALVLRGDEAEANRLYHKSFEYMTVESDFQTGLVADFDFFINKGLNEAKFLELKQYYLQYYIENWKYPILGDSFKQRGQDLKDRLNFDEAAKMFQQSEAMYRQAKNPDWSKIRNVIRWAGYSIYKLKDYKTSLKYYSLGAEITKLHDLGEDNLITDYTDMSNIYDWLDDTLNQSEYNTRATSLEVALREKRDPKKLYMVIIGPDNKGLNDSFAKADATAISGKLHAGADLHFDEVINHTLVGENATKAAVIDALDSAIYNLGENDVFMFYFSGHGRNTFGEGIQLTDGILTLRDLAGYLGQIPAGRQIHIADCNGMNWREWYQRGNFGLLANSQRSLLFMGLKSARIEESALGHSVLTSALLKSYDKTIADGSLSGAEWIGSSITGLLHEDKLYAIEFQAFGHDFVLGKQKIALATSDTFPPQIELYGATATRGENISLVSGKGVSTGRIYDDSRIVFAQVNGLPLVLSANGRFEMPKELAGLKNIRIIAVDEFGNRSQRDFVVTQSENTPTNEGVRYAFLFASDDYEHWTDLANPIFDASSISELLAKHYDYTVEVIRNPSKRIITEKLDYIRRLKFKANDQLLVFFAGHGLYDSVWGGYYVCPESELQANDKYFESFYPQQTIADLLDGSHARNVFLVMDVCFGGKMFDKHDNREFKSVNDGNELSSEEYIQRQLEIPCRQFLTSGGNNYVEDGVPGAHSPFASRFILALEEGATNKEFLTASEIMDYLRMMKTVGNDKKSFPRYGFFGGDKDGEYVLKVTRKIRNSAIIAGI